MAITSTELNQLTLQRQILMRQLERKELSENEYTQKYNAVSLEIEKAQSKLLDAEAVKTIEKQKDEQRRIEIMADKTEKKQKAPKVATAPKVRKERSNSRANVIIEVLQLKGVKDMNAAADKVVEKVPGADKNNVKAQINAIIGLVKKQGSARWQKFSWDADNFQLTVK